MNGRWLAGSLLTGMVLSGSMAVNAANLETLFYANTNENVVTNYYDQAGLYAPGYFEDKTYHAFLALKEMDLNQDGSTELLAIRLVDEEEESQNVLTAEVYRQEGKKINRIAQYELADNVLASDTVTCDVFLVYDGGTPFICCEDKEEYTALADGVDWNLRIARFDGYSFVEVADDSMTGSDWQSQNLNFIWKDLASVSVYPDEVINVPILEQVTENTERLCSIQRYMTADYSELWNYLNNGDGRLFIYGETEFYDYANQDMENKIVSDFGSSMETGTYYDDTEIYEDDFSAEYENGTVYQYDDSYEQNYQYDQSYQDYLNWKNRQRRQNSQRYQYQQYYDESEFVIPDSNSRYLTKYDLAGLSEYELRIARNEIYARHGRGFNNDEMREYFNSKSWYRETVSADNFTYEYASRVFNDYEVANIDTIKAYEKAHNFNQ